MQYSAYGWEPDYEECIKSYDEDDTDYMIQDAIDISKEKDAPMCITRITDEDGDLEYSHFWDNIDEFEKE